jgi:hypothetical protein
MAHPIRSAGPLACLFAVLLCLPCAPRAQAPVDAPPALREWLPWVLEGHESARCPLLNAPAADAAAERVCAWPGELSVDAGADGARFALRWDVEARSAVPLPGDASRWPQGVRANGVPVAVVPDAEGHPVVWVEAGTWRFDGRFDWTQRPESLLVPDAIARIALAVDGARVFPLQREEGSLWLGQPPSAAREADALSVQVFRRLADGVPAMLETVLYLQVSGAGREVALDAPLPEGFVATALAGELPARQGVDGALRVQLRPGFHELRLTARALLPLARVVRPDARGNWPAQEVWSYAADGRLRITDATGGTPIDPQQAGVPDDWATLPALLLDPGGVLEVAERSRGLSTQEANRLQLRRALWLDFDGGGWTARDRLDGTMVRDWRLDLAEPFVMTRGEADGEGLLVTRGGEPGLTGVELRAHGVALDVGARIEGAPGTLPVGGWNASLDAVDTTLNLPPGWRLYAAPGADLAPTSWVAQWTLLDLFLAALLVMMAGALCGPIGAFAALGFVLLGWREPGAPVLSLLALLALGLVLRALGDGRLARSLRWLRIGVLAVAGLLSLAFGAQQLRLALHPQLERYGMGAPQFAGRADNAVDKGVMVLGESPAAAMPAPAAPEYQALDSITVTGSRIKRNALLQRYSSDALIQAGGSDPAWSWSAHTLRWSGPVLPDQQVRLLLSPPWLTRLLRVLAVIALAALLWRLGRGASSGLRAPRGATAVAAVALLAIGSAQAADYPPQSLLDALRDRALAAEPCSPHCARIAAAEVSASGERIEVALELHAAARSAIAVPASEPLAALTSATLDGVPVDTLLRRDAGEHWMVVGRGVHRLVVVLQVADADRVPLRFPQAPAQVRFAGRDWEAGGLRDGALLTDTLDLVRVRTGGSSTATASAQQFQPFVRVQRSIEFDLEWRVTTQVQRMAPQQGGLTVSLPLLAGERVATPGLEVVDGRVTIALQPGQDVASWDSQLERAEMLRLEAPDLSRHAEVWQVVASPTWNLRFEGVPAVRPEDENDWVHEFHPLPGESLSIAVARPEAVAGATLAIDGVTLDSRAGVRASTHTLALDLRSTQGGQHPIQLPADAELLAVRIDGASRSLRIDDGRLVLPLRPGRQRIEVDFRRLVEIGSRVETPPVSLGAPAGNLRIGIDLPAGRWLLAVGGPAVGPAVLYWAALLVLLVGAVALSRTGRTPLRLHDWLLLGLGFSTFSWLALALVVAWLFALDLRGRSAAPESAWVFDLRQVGIALLTFVALVALLAAVPAGLLGTPDMQVEGNGSTATALRWYADRSLDALPQAVAWSAPLWAYKAAMLAWALWLAWALLRWLRWGWACASKDGWWRALPRAPRKETAAAAPAVAPPPPRPE